MIMGARIMVSRQLVVVGLLLSLMPSVVGSTAITQESEFEALLAEALTTHRNNLEAWRSYSFRSEVRRERLDKKGEVEWSLEFALRNSPTESGIDEELIKVEGRAPTAAEIEEHREAARFTKHYLEVLEGKVGHPLASDQLTTLAILEESEYSYGGR